MHRREGNFRYNHDGDGDREIARRVLQTQQRYAKAATSILDGDTGVEGEAYAAVGEDGITVAPSRS